MLTVLQLRSDFLFSLLIKARLKRMKSKNIQRVKSKKKGHFSMLQLK